MVQGSSWASSSNLGLISSYPEHGIFDSVGLDQVVLGEVVNQAFVSRAGAAPGHTEWFAGDFSMRVCGEEVKRTARAAELG